MEFVGGKSQGLSEPRLGIEPSPSANVLNNAKVTDGKKGLGAG